MKSTPSFGVLAATIVASTVVSPYVASTAPSACRAILPVSMVSLRPPQSSSTRCISNIVSFFHGFRRAPKAMSKTARGCRASSRYGKQQRLAILPWRFEPCLVARAILYRLLPNRRPRPSPPAQKANARCAFAARTHRAQCPARNNSSAYAELLDQIFVARFICTTQVIEQLTALADKLEQPTTGMIILDVILEMLGEIVDALGQDCHLYFRRPGVSGLLCLGLDYFGLAVGGYRHCASVIQLGVSHL